MPPMKRLAIVGPCGAGKTTLERGLKQAGYEARAIVQEHSFVPDLWQRFTQPELLIFLQASRSVGAARRQMQWSEAEWQEQQHRLQHAREHADLLIDTDELTIQQVLERCLDFLHAQP